MTTVGMAPSVPRVLIVVCITSICGLFGGVQAINVFHMDQNSSPVRSINGIDDPGRADNAYQDKNAIKKSADWVTKVHIISMNHLDVGYDGIPGQQTGFINNVLHYYFHDYFPRAGQLGRALKHGGYVETFVYTTHAWLVSMYLDCPPDFVLGGIRLQCPNHTEVADFEAAVHAGYITWHASPMNLQPEFAPNPELFGLALDLSSELDTRFGIVRKTKVMSQRDVPGMTRSVIPILAGRGITGVSVGVNNMSPPAKLPKLFRWTNGKDEVLGTWHGGGYPDPPGPTPSQPGGISIDDCVVLPHFPEALCFAFRSDNQGPPLNVREILNYYEILRAQFPNAELRGSRLEDYFLSAETIRDQLPAVDVEIGDTWIQGDASDPRKCAEVRAIGRALGACLRTGRCDPVKDARVWNATRIFAKTFEHTWGLSAELDLVHWSNREFSANRDATCFLNCEVSWVEQRQIYEYAIQALGAHPVVDDIRQELSQLKPALQDLSDYKTADLKSAFKCPGMDKEMVMGFGEDGALTKLKYDGTDWASDSSGLGKFVYQTYNDSDYTDFANQYSFYRDRNVGIHKANMSLYANPESKNWDVSLKELWQHKSGKCDFVVELTMKDDESWTNFGAPRAFGFHYVAKTEPQPGVDITFQFFNKTVTRLPEAVSIFFQPLAKPGASWKLSKLGGLVDPHNVVLNGSQYQHALDDSGMFYENAKQSIQISSPDVPVVILSTETFPYHSAFPVPLEPIKDTILGGGFNIYNNVWDTNWIFWYPYLEEDQAFKARFSIKFK